MSVTETSAPADIETTLRGKILAMPSSTLDEYRERLETKGWSSDTMHRDFRAQRPADAAPSHGQCGVSSFWLIEKLQVDHGLEAVYCYGDVLSAEDRSPIVARHCWVEVGGADDPDRVIVDVTWDQVRGLTRDSVLREPHGDLMTHESVDYAARIRLSRDDLSADASFWDRFILLKEALREDVSDLSTRA